MRRLDKLASLAKTSAKLKMSMGMPPPAAPMKGGTVGPMAGSAIKPSMPAMPKTPATGTSIPSVGKMGA